MWGLFHLKSSRGRTGWVLRYGTCLRAVLVFYMATPFHTIESVCSRGARARFGLWILKVKGPTYWDFGPFCMLYHHFYYASYYPETVLTLQLSPLITHFFLKFGYSTNDSHFSSDMYNRYLWLQKVLPYIAPNQWQLTHDVKCTQKYFSLQFSRSQ